jgi:hypothetical protein
MRLITSVNGIKSVFIAGLLGKSFFLSVQAILAGNNTNLHEP